MTENDLRPRLISLADGSEVILPETAIFGRKSDSTIPLPDNRVSRRHSMIRRQEDDDFWFYDLGSFNGSYINNERVTTTRQLEPGDVIRICDFEYRFELPQAGPRPGRRPGNAGGAHDRSWSAISKASPASPKSSRRTNSPRPSAHGIPTAIRC